jgi:hypothetical protein
MGAVACQSARRVVAADQAALRRALMPGSRRKRTGQVRWRGVVKTLCSTSYFAGFIAATGSTSGTLRSRSSARWNVSGLD